MLDKLPGCEKPEGRGNMGDCAESSIAAKARGLPGWAFSGDASVFPGIADILRGKNGGDPEFFPGSFPAGKPVISPEVLPDLME